MRKYFHDRGIKKYHGEVEGSKAAVCERFIRVLKGRLYKYMTAQNTHCWTEPLDKITNAINHSHCRAIGAAPAEINDENWWPLWKRLYGVRAQAQTQRTPAYAPGDYVRLARKPKAFDRGYHPNFTAEVFRVGGVHEGRPITFSIVDLNKRPIPGRKYAQQLSRSSADTLYRVERVIRRRKNAEGQEEVLVKWHGLPPSANSWISDFDLDEEEDI